MSERQDVVGGSGYGVAPPGFRLPAGTRPGPVRLEVADLDRSVGFYGRVLGLRPLPDPPDGASRPEREAERTVEGRAAVLGAGAGRRPLVELRERPGAAPVPRAGRLGLYHYAILLPDRAALGRFVGHLASLGVRAGASDHLVSEALYLQDPDGLGIEVYADRPRDAWRYRGRELVMSTDPLDLASVRAAAGDEPWTGMPDGARMGHVHLHVGDLERAAAFYHEGLGLDRVVWSYPGALFLSAGGYHHHLGLNTWAAGARPAQDGDARLLEWEILVPSLQEANGALASLEAAGHPVERAPDGGVARDPWGTAVRIREAGRRPA